MTLEMVGINIGIGFLITMLVIALIVHREEIYRGFQDLFSKKEKPRPFIYLEDKNTNRPCFYCELWTKKDGVDVKVRGGWTVELYPRTGPNGKSIKDWRIESGWENYTFISDQKMADMLRPMKIQLSEALLFHAEEKVRSVATLLFKDDTNAIKEG